MLLTEFSKIESLPQRISYRAKIHLGVLLDFGEMLQRAVRQDALEQIHLDAVDALDVAEVVDGLPDAELQKAHGLPPPELHPSLFPEERGPSASLAG